ncbi:hypothetical protein, partial [Enterococcus raffinosus]|uniref:hypothetical protein n=1 Tax=Enterococcus raffinosus TaxID=71452 RepID=UPI00054EDF56
PAKIFFKEMTIDRTFENNILTKFSLRIFFSKRRKARGKVKQSFSPECFLFLAKIHSFFAKIDQKL